LIGLYFSVQRWNFFAAWLTASRGRRAARRAGAGFGAKDASIIPLQIGVPWRRGSSQETIEEPGIFAKAESVGQPPRRPFPCESTWAA